MDLSPLTPYYATPSMRLYSAAEVLATLRPTDLLLKIDLTSGFYQIPMRQEHRKFNGIRHKGVSYTFNRLPMGHPLALSILQRLAQAVASSLHQHFGISMVAYLDDWLLFASTLPADEIFCHIQSLGITINFQKSTPQPVSALVYLGLYLNVTDQTLRPTPDCLRHMGQLIALVPAASPQDLRRIVGYTLWLCWAMGWPTFMATLLFIRDTYWYRWFQAHHLLEKPRSIQTRRHIQVHTDATPNALGVYILSTPPHAIHQPLDPPLPIAEA